MTWRDDRSPLAAFTSLVLVTCAFVVSCSPADCTHAGPRPNILLVVVDTLRADHLGSYGYTRDTSPHLDSLAADAIRYTRAFSQAPWTTPAMAALMTSRHPASLGITNIQSPLPDDVVLLPEILSRAGYDTAAFVSHSFVSEKWGFARGFDTFDQSQVKGHMATTSPRLSDLALAWLEARGVGDAPFFLFVHYFDPHFGYLDQPGFGFGGRDPSYTGSVRSGVLPARFDKRTESLSDADLRELERLYDSEIALTDRAIGRLLDFLRESDLYDSSLVIVTGDHGEEFLDHGALDHTKTLYDELMNVPLIVKLPGRAPAVVDRPVALVDLLPTVTDWLEIEPPDGVRGLSLLAEPTEPRPILLETQRLRRLRGVVYGQHKLIVDLESGAVELFDLSADPDERNDLSDERAELVEALRLLLDSLSSQGGLRGQPLELTDEERERLKALGYL
ncbi:MAG: sulfatase [Deltaproteobacteria bacterium]|nr:sulfatase [Deltaproteobacteria bacterium]